MPIGLIQTCWGGTLAGSWTSKEALELDPDFTNGLKHLSEIPASKAEAQKKYETAYAQWQKDIDNKDAGMKNGKALWVTPNVTFLTKRSGEIRRFGMVQAHHRHTFLNGRQEAYDTIGPY